MKKIFIILFISIMLFGCSKEIEESNEVKLCNSIDSYIEKYNNKELTYSDLLTNLNTLYDEYCNEENNTCNTIKNMNTYNSVNYELQDCSKYQDGSFKDLCEANNNSVQKRMDTSSQLESAEVFELNRNCSLAREK